MEKTLTPYRAAPPTPTGFCAICQENFYDIESMFLRHPSRAGHIRVCPSCYDEKSRPKRHWTELFDFDWNSILWTRQVYFKYENELALRWVRFTDLDQIEGHGYGT